MDMEIIDNIWIGTLDQGDYIEFFDEDGSLGIREVKEVEDHGDNMLIISTEGDEMLMPSEEWFDIYGYTSTEEI